MIRVLTREGEEREIEAVVGESVMEAIRAAGIDELLAICGGCCSCGTCHVYIEEGPEDLLGPKTDDEDAVLGYSDFREQNSRLSCQIAYSDELAGLSVRIAPED